MNATFAARGCTNVVFHTHVLFNIEDLITNHFSTLTPPKSDSSRDSKRKNFHSSNRGSVHLPTSAKVTMLNTEAKAYVADPGWNLETDISTGSIFLKAAQNLLKPVPPPRPSVAQDTGNHLISLELRSGAPKIATSISSPKPVETECEQYSPTEAQSELFTKRLPTPQNDVFPNNFRSLLSELITAEKARKSPEEKEADRRRFIKMERRHSVDVVQRLEYPMAKLGVFRRRGRSLGFIPVYEDESLEGRLWW